MNEKVCLKISEKDWSDRGFSVETIKTCLGVGLGRGLGGRVIKIDKLEVIGKAQPPAPYSLDYLSRKN